MFVGICTIELKIYEAHSLKEKRRVIKSVIERIKARYNASIIEAGQQDKWQMAEVGFACASLTKADARKAVEKIINFMESDHRFEMIHVHIEVL